MSFILEAYDMIEGKQSKQREQEACAYSSYTRRTSRELSIYTKITARGSPAALPDQLVIAGGYKRMLAHLRQKSRQPSNLLAANADMTQNV